MRTKANLMCLTMILLIGLFLVPHSNQRLRGSLLSEPLRNQRRWIQVLLLYYRLCSRL